MDNIADIREYDVPYHVRVAIDRKINVVSILIGLIEQCWYIHIYQGHWYYVKGCGSTEPPEIRLVDEEPDRPVSTVNVCHTNLHVQCTCMLYCICDPILENWLSDHNVLFQVVRQNTRPAGLLLFLELQHYRTYMYYPILTSCHFHHSHTKCFNFNLLLMLLTCSYMYQCTNFLFTCTNVRCTNCLPMCANVPIVWSINSVHVVKWMWCIWPIHKISSLSHDWLSGWLSGAKHHCVLRRVHTVSAT